MSTELIRELREKTGAGMMDCKKALLECSNDLEKATEYLRKKGIAKAAKRQGRVAGEGLIHSYIHSGSSIGVLLELNCETDFVAKTEDFKLLAHEISLQVAAANPRYVSETEIPSDVIDKERSVYHEIAERSGKPSQVIEKIVDGQVKKFYEEVCLLKQPYVKEPKKKIETLIQEFIGKLGENITVRRFARFQVGEAGEKTE